MWLRASYTVENAVITPLFMIIMMIVIRMCCNMHDNLIQTNVNSQVVIQNELEEVDGDNENIYIIKAEEYLKKRTIFLKEGKAEPDASMVRTSSPEKTIRMMNALKELKN